MDATLTRRVVTMLAMTAMTSWAEDTEKSRAELLAAYVPTTTVERDLQLPGMAETLWFGGVSGPGSTVRAAGGVRSESARWMKFETEFGITERESSWAGATLQSAKYELDKTVFQLDNFVGEVRKAFEIDFDLGTMSRRMSETRAPRRVYFDPIRDIFENARLRSELDLVSRHGRAFIGVTLKFPMGN